MIRNGYFRVKACTFAVLLATCSLFGVIKETFASGRAIMMSPMTQRVVLVPGETYYGGFKVANPADAETDLNYLATIAPFSMAQTENNIKNYNEPDYTTRTNMNMITDWVEIDNPADTVKPNGEEVVSFKIKVPEDAPAGGQYMAILVKEDPEKREIDDSLAVTEVMQMAHIIYAEVAGETRQEGDILENNVPSFIMNSELAATSMVRNDGNIHTDAETILQVWPLFSDEEICTNEENASSIFVMPGTERYHTETCQLPSVGIFRAKQTVKIFGETSIVEKTIVVCPIWLLFIIIFVVFALIFYFVARARARKKAAKK